VSFHITRSVRAPKRVARTLRERRARCALARCARAVRMMHDVVGLSPSRASRGSVRETRAARRRTMTRGRVVRLAAVLACAFAARACAAACFARDEVYEAKNVPAFMRRAIRLEVRARVLRRCLCRCGAFSLTGLFRGATDARACAVCAGVLGALERHG